MKNLKFVIFAACLALMSNSFAQNIPYQTPDKVIRDLLDAPVTPLVSISPDRSTLLLLELPSMPSITEVAEEELRIGGLRISPNTNGGSRSRYYNGLRLKSMDHKTEKEILDLPEKPRIENVSWSPSGTYIAFTNTIASGLELWIIDVAIARAKKLTDARVNDAIAGTPYQWYPDGNKILVKLTNGERTGPPQKPHTPNGPVIQENTQGAAPVRTYQDLLKNPYDESLFAYFTEAELIAIDCVTGDQKQLDLEGIFLDLDISPDGKYLLTSELRKPFSYVVPYYRFAQDIAVYAATDGSMVRKLASVPASENIPKGFNAVRTGPRNHGWRSDHPATLYWVEAQDGGDPNVEAAIRDQLFTLAEPFSGLADSSISFNLRYAGITWGTDDLAIAREYWWSSRREMISRWQPGSPMDGKEVLFDRSYEDRYSDPGDFQTTVNENGRSVLLTDETGELYLTGIGASVEGNRPFVDRYNLETKQSERLWRSEAPYYEIPTILLDTKKGVVLTRRESTNEPPNYFIRNLKSGKLTQLTDFPNPYAAMDGVSKELVKYQRKDGIELTGTLYLPPGYDKVKDGRLPVLMWAYPREYKSKAAAGQVRNSPYEFLRLYYGSPIYWVMRGYAVFDNFAMPIIGEGDEESNDKFVPQLVQGAEAAIEKIVDMGIADPNRLAVGGHSYGAFMTANLLAHCDLFAAGIARSGAYNRTLTPFGFQAEERTFWEAPDVYFTMSPFMHADKIKEPILLIHGEADNNSGTYPMQSERFYAALKGHGATVRLVMLPHESHGYRARESIMHMMWEMDSWLEKHVKNKTADAKKKKSIKRS